MARPFDAPLMQYEIDCCKRDEVFRIASCTFNIPFYLMLAIIYVAPPLVAAFAKAPPLKIGALLFFISFGGFFAMFPLSLANQAARARSREYAVGVVEGRHGWHEHRWQPAGEEFRSLPKSEWPVSIYDKIGERHVRFPSHWGSTVRIMNPHMRVRLAAPVPLCPSAATPLATVVAIEGGPSIEFEHDCGLGAHPTGERMVMVWHATVMTGLSAPAAVFYHGFNYFTVPLTIIACGFALWTTISFVRGRIFMWRLSRAYSKADIPFAADPLFDIF